MRAVSEPRCRSCGGQQLLDLGACAPISGAPDSGRLLRCSACGLGQRQPCIDGAELEEHYRNTPAEAMEYPFESNCAWKRARELLAARAGGADMAVLDVGCHTGTFLGGLPEHWRRFGVESAVEPAREARETQGVEIIAGLIETIDASWDGKFDAVTLFDVVEHLPDPAAALLRLSRLLRPGGVLIASTADLDAWTWRWSRGRHWYLQTPLHLSVASMAFFEHVAARAAMRIESADRIAHRLGSREQRQRQFVETIYWELRQRGGWYRIPQRLLHLLPGMGKLPHRETVTWAMTLRDHLIVAMAESR
jgi:SAM-dependent methyltransferase